MMEQTVLREHSIFELALAVTQSNASVYTTLSEEYVLRDCVILQVKNKAYKTCVNNGYDYSIGTYNVVTISVKKKDASDNLNYSMILSCKMFGITQRMYAVDSGEWRVVNENIDKDYKFTMEIQIEPVIQTPFAILYEDKRCLDFKLKSQDGDIEIHKALLATKSRAFRSKLDELSDDFLEVPQTNVHSLEDFKKFVYLNTLPTEKQDLEKLLLLASFFEMKWMEFKCVDKLMHSLLVTSSCAAELLEFALNHKLMTLFLGILEMIQSGQLKVTEISKSYLRL